MAATITFLQVNGDATDNTTFTFNGVNFGTAAAGRYLIVAVSGRAVSNSPTITGITIGGVSATIAIQVRDVAGLNIQAIAIAAVPTGTSGTVVVTFDQTLTNCDIAMYSTSDVGSVTAFDTGSSTADPGNILLDIPAGGIALALAKSDAGTGTCAWTNLTERYDQLDANGNNISGASDAFASAQTNLSITADFSAAAVRPIMAAASFSPVVSAIKTIDGLALASVKTVDGLAIASVKNINGLA